MRAEGRRGLLSLVPLLAVVVVVQRTLGDHLGGVLVAMALVLALIATGVRMSFLGRP